MTKFSASGDTINNAEIHNFEDLAVSWWDESGPMAPLHKINPLRLQYIRERVSDHFGIKENSIKKLKMLNVLDVGCGGGLLTEPLARMGANVTGIDASQTIIQVAKDHSRLSRLKINYFNTSAEQFATKGHTFDVVTSMEVVEHVANLPLFIETLTSLTRPGGAIILSTLNRTLISWLVAIIAGEYILRCLPRGTHDWAKFVKPSELRRMLAAGGARVQNVCGITRTLGAEWSLSKDPSINYLLFAAKTAEN